MQVLRSASLQPFEAEDRVHTLRVVVLSLWWACLTTAAGSTISPPPKSTLTPKQLFTETSGFYVLC